MVMKYEDRILPFDSKALRSIRESLLKRIINNKLNADFFCEFLGFRQYGIAKTHQRISKE